jgi:hypothetical protein
MRRFRRYLPLLAGPVLLLLFVVTGELIGPGEGDDGLYEKVRHLRKRSSTLEKAGELLSDVNDYLGIDEKTRAILSPVDPKSDWTSILEPLGDGAFSWSEIPMQERDRYELHVIASFREIHELFARIDARGAGTQIEEMVMRGEGTNVAVTLLVAVSRGEGGA